MFIKIKLLAKKTILNIFALLNKTKIGGYAFQQILNSAMDATQSLTHNQTQLLFSVPNRLNHFRVDSFSTKEPETLEWIDNFPPESVFWDIGANIGLYSCYAAKARNCKVFAFEPSVFNLELLARNIYLNQLTANVCIVPLPLSNDLCISTLNMTSKDWGGALSTFGEDYGDDGKILNKIFEFRTLGMSMDLVSAILNIPIPSHIKIDVDGIEQLILSGGNNILSQVSEVFIEVNEDFVAQHVNVERLLGNAGLVFMGKRHSAMYDNNLRFGNTYNQFWFRPE